MTLAALKARLQDLVSASPLLAGRPVLLEDKGNLVSELETVLQTQSLAVVIALASGQVKDGALRRRALWVETFEVVIHRGPLDGADVPATDTVLEDLRARLHGAPLDPAGPGEGAFACVRHDLRDGGDGTYARVLTVAIESSISSHP
jgi:hypothetical protein